MIHHTIVQLVYDEVHRVYTFSVSQRQQTPAFTGLSEQGQHPEEASQPVGPLGTAFRAS